MKIAVTYNHLFEMYMVWPVFSVDDKHAHIETFDVSFGGDLFSAATLEEVGEWMRSQGGALGAHASHHVHGVYRKGFIPEAGDVDGANHPRDTRVVCTDDIKTELREIFHAMCKCVDTAIFPVPGFAEVECRIEGERLLVGNHGAPDSECTDIAGMLNE